MNLLKQAVCAAMLLPLNCFASSQIDLQEFSCTGLQSTDSTSNLTVNCDGDLSLKGGAISANGDIMLKASGRIMLDNISIETPTNITFDATSVDTTATVALNVSGYVHPGNGLGGLRIGGDLIRAPLELSGNGSRLGALQPVPTPSAPLCVGSAGRVICKVISPGGGSRQGSGNTAGGIIISSGYHWGVQPPPCAESTFRVKQSSERSCPTEKIKIKEDAFVRVVGECAGNPSQFLVSASQDFPDDASTVAIKANCSTSGKYNAACVLYNPTTSDGVLSMPTAFTGLLKLVRRANGQIRNLQGDILQQTSDDCSSQIHLKSLSRL